MYRIVVALISSVWFLLVTGSLGAQSGRRAVCPNADPINRPSYIDLSHQSMWDIEKVANWMHLPDSTILQPGKGLVLVVSHRGDWEYCPENTVESFQSAWDLGAEAIEMDIRLSAPGIDGEIDYPNGEAFLSHDFDIRGEAPNPEASGQNYITSLTPGQLRLRNMADRHGLILRDSDGKYLHLKSLTDVLTSMVARARHLNLLEDEGGGWSKVAGGVVLIFDVKNFAPPNGAQPKTTQFQTFMEALKEVNDFEISSKVYVDDAVAYKVGFGHFVSDFANGGTYGTPAELIAHVTNPQEVDYIAGRPLPRLIFIVFPEDVCKYAQKPPKGKCVETPPSEFTALNDYGKNYTLSKSNDIRANRLIANDWQYRNENDALATYLTYQIKKIPDGYEWNGWYSWGSAMFLASNNFAEGVRNSAADCKNGSHSYYSFADGPYPSTNYPRVNASSCVSDPLQRWASTSLDYLVPSFAPLKHATTITTDQFQNAMDYLTAIGLNNQERIRYQAPNTAKSSLVETKSTDRKKETDAR